MDVCAKKKIEIMKRKQFLRNSATVAAGAVLLGNKTFASMLGKPAQRPVGLQLYTFFNVIDDDVEGTLKKIAAIGYKEIESAFSKKGGYYGMKPKEFSSFISGL